MDWLGRPCSQKVPSQYVQRSAWQWQWQSSVAVGLVNWHLTHASLGRARFKTGSDKGILIQRQLISSGVLNQPHFQLHHIYLRRIHNFNTYVHKMFVKRILEYSVLLSVVSQSVCHSHINDEETEASVLEELHRKWGVDVCADHLIHFFSVSDLKY